MVGVDTLIISILTLIALVTFNYVLGGIVVNRNLKVRKPSGYSDFFYHSWVGFFLAVSVYAVLLSKGVTILLPIPLLLFVFTGKYKAPENTCQSNPLQTNFFVILVLTLFIYWFYFVMHFCPLADGVVQYIEGDNLFYANTSEFLNFSGKESNSLDYVYSESAGPVLYHYIDLWSGAFFSKVSGLRAVYVFYLILYPMLALYVVAGLISFFEKKKGASLSFAAYLSVIFFAFYSGFSLFFPHKLFPADILDFSIVYKQKFFVIAFFLVIFLNELIKKNWAGVLIFSGIVSLSFITVLPAVYLFCLLGTIVLLLLKKTKFRKILFGSVLLIAVVAYVYFFYRNSSSSGSAKTSFQDVFFSANYLKTGINITAGGIIQYALFIPVLAVLAGMMWKSKNKTLRSFIAEQTPELFFIFVSLCGLICWALLHPFTFEAVQFYSNLFIPAGAFLVVFSLYYLIELISSKIFKLGLVLLVFSVVLLDGPVKLPVASSPSVEVKELKEFIGAYKGLFANMRPLDRFSNIFEINTVVYQPLPVISYFKKPYSNISLDMPWVSLDSSSGYLSEQKRIINNSPFMNYYSRNKGISKEQIITGFLKEKGIKFITIASEMSTPEFLVNMQIDELKLPSSGWKVIKLKF